MLAALTRSWPGLTPGSQGHQAIMTSARPFTAQNSLSVVTSELVSYHEASHWLLDNFRLR